MESEVKSPGRHFLILVPPTRKLIAVEWPTQPRGQHETLTGRSKKSVGPAGVGRTGDRANHFASRETYNWQALTIDLTRDDAHGAIPFNWQVLTIDLTHDDACGAIPFDHANTAPDLHPSAGSPYPNTKTHFHTRSTDINACAFTYSCPWVANFRLRYDERWQARAVSLSGG